MQSDLTRAQQKALDWIASNDHHRARWLRDGKDACGSPEKWDTFEISGRTKRIRIAKSDLQAIGALIKASSLESRMFEVSTPATPTQEGK